MTVGVASAADNYGTEYGPHTSMLCLKSSQEDESSTAVVVNWTATIGLVQDVARRFKTLQISTQALARDTDGALKSATADAAAAETRARDARTEASAAHQRADLAERQIELLAHDLAAARERIEKAECRVAMLSKWLKDIHNCLIDEFDYLTIAPLHSI